METLTALLQDSADRFGGKPALVTRRRYLTERWSYRDLRETSEGIAARLRALGYRRGDRVLVWAPNAPEWVVLFFGCMRAGIILVPLDIRSAPDFIQRVREKTDARCVLVSDATREQARALGIPVHRLEDLRGDARGDAPDALLPLPRGEDTAEIMFTSGTTGEPKGVVLTHRNIVSNVLAATQVVPTAPSQRLLSLLPLSHMLEQTGGLLAPLRGGATVVYPASRQPAVIFRALGEHGVTNMVLVPQVLQLFWGAIEREVDKRGKREQWERLLRISARLPLPLRRVLFRPVLHQLGGRLEFVLCGGAYLDPDLARRWELLGVPVLQGYGTTEASPVVTGNTMKGRRLDSVGRSLPGQEVRIAPDGEVLVRGPNVTQGYWQNPAATEDTFDGEWYRTGDLGTLDADGYLYLKGRKKDMIVLANGMKVHAQDVEEAVKAHPAVADACVVGLPANDGTVRVHAALLLKDPSAEVRQIAEGANARLAEHQRLHGVTVWPLPDFPRTHTLKVKKHEVLDFLLGRALPEAPAAPSAPGARTNVPVAHALIAQAAGVAVDKVLPDMNLGGDLKLDSLGRVELLAAVEAETGTYVDESAVSAQTTVAQLDALVAAAKAEARATRIPTWQLRWLARTVRAVAQAALVFPLVRYFAPMRVTGRERLRGLNGPVLFAANHLSHADTPAVLAALPRRLRSQVAVAAAADAWFDQPRSRAFWAGLLFNAFPFSRGGAVRPTLAHCCRLVEGGWSILIYPEGGRTPSGPMRPFKSGTGLMAVELGVPVVPVYVQGTAEVLAKDSSVPKRGRVAVTFGEPLRFPKSISYLEATERLEAAVRRLGAPRDEPVPTAA